MGIDTDLKCKSCGCKLLIPPLRMSRAEAISLFVDSRGGRCTDCYLALRKAETEAWMREEKRKYELITAKGLYGFRRLPQPFGHVTTRMG